MYTPRTSVEAIPNASIHHSALQNRDFGHTYDRSRALVRALVSYYSGRCVFLHNYKGGPLKRGICVNADYCNFVNF